MANALSRLALILAGAAALVSGDAVAQGASVSSRPGLAAASASPWVKGHQSSVRLVAGAEALAGGGVRRLAGVELRLAEGWKTYWRHPGDDGGLPPTFDWSASRNLKSARVLYPAPERIASKTGTSIGYGGSVVFPVEIEAVDTGLPIELGLGLEYGICKDICVPAEARLQLVVSPTLAVMPREFAQAMARVPGPPVKGTERLVAAKAQLTGAAPSLVFEVAVASGPRSDLFVEAPTGVHLPLAQPVGLPRGGVQTFRIDLKGVDDIAQLKGKSLRLTITDGVSGVETGWTVR